VVDQEGDRADVRGRGVLPQSGNAERRRAKAVTERFERAAGELTTGVRWQLTCVTADRLHLAYVADDVSVRRHLDHVGVEAVSVLQVVDRFAADTNR
jgi:hypothetical protein